MFGTLIESRGVRERSVGGTAASVVAHSALIGGALFATARAKPRVEKPENPNFQAVYIAPLPVPHHPSTAQTSTPHAQARPWIFVEPKINVNVLPIDVGAGLAAPSMENRGASPFTTSPVNGIGGVATGDTFTSEQVEKQVSLVAGSASPRYPESLRAAGIEGRVTARFVVNVNGRAEADSAVIVRSSNVLFDAAVRSALARMRFVPAEVGGRKVRQLVEMPFVFALDK